MKEQLVKATQRSVENKAINRRKTQLQERMVRAYEADVDDAIAFRSFMKNVIKGAGLIWLLSLIFGENDESVGKKKTR